MADQLTLKVTSGSDETDLSGNFDRSLESIQTYAAPTWRLEQVLALKMRQDVNIGFQRPRIQPRVAALLSK